jgi:hypothetical protein
MRAASLIRAMELIISRKMTLITNTKFRGLLWSLAILGLVFIGGALVTGTVSGALTIVVTLIVVGIVGALIT